MEPIDLVVVIEFIVATILSITILTFVVKQLKAAANTIDNKLLEMENNKHMDESGNTITDKSSAHDIANYVLYKSGKDDIYDTPNFDNGRYCSCNLVNYKSMAICFTCNQFNKSAKHNLSELVLSSGNRIPDNLNLHNPLCHKIPEPDAYMRISFITDYKYHLNIRERITK